MSFGLNILPRFAVLLASASLLNAQSFPNASSVYVHYSADNMANVTTAPLSQTFTSANVDLTNQLLTGLPDLGFPSVSKSYATPVYFSTTGTLPAPLQPNTPYYVVGTAAGGYKVYPVATDADAPYQPGSLLGEKVHIAQNAYLGVRSIVFTNGGSGTHTLSTKKLLFQLNDLTANGFNSAGPNSANKHAMLELDTDASGHWYFKTLGAIARENWVGPTMATARLFSRTETSTQPGSGSGTSGSSIRSLSARCARSRSGRFSRCWTIRPTSTPRPTRSVMAGTRE